MWIEFSKDEIHQILEDYYGEDFDSSTWYEGEIKTAILNK